MSNRGYCMRVAFYSTVFSVLLVIVAGLWATWYDRDRANRGTDVRNMPACADDATSMTGKYPCFFDGKRDGNGHGDSYISTNGQPNGIIYITNQK